jgi:hypothetical protein
MSPMIGRLNEDLCCSCESELDFEASIQVRWGFACPECVQNDDGSLWQVLE